MYGTRERTDSNYLGQHGLDSRSKNSTIWLARYLDLLHVSCTAHYFHSLSNESPCDGSTYPHGGSSDQSHPTNPALHFGNVDTLSVGEILQCTELSVDD